MKMKIKNSIHTEYFTYEEFVNFDLFKLRIKELMKNEGRYSLIFRVYYSSNFDELVNKYLDHGGSWKSLGEQVSFLYDTNNYDSIIDNIYTSITSRIKYSMELYEKNTNDITCFQVLIHNVNYTKQVEEKKYFSFDSKSLGDNKDLVNVSETAKQFKILPLTTNFDDYGTKLLTTFENDVMFMSIENKKINVIEWNTKFKKKDDVINIDKNTLFYQNKEQKFIILINVSNNKHIIDIYNESGIMIYHIEDIILGEKNFMRKIGNIRFFINSKGIYNKEIDISFDPIKKKRLSKIQEKMIHPDWRIGTLDLETYKDIDNYSKIYAAGFYADGKCKTFYINKELNSEKVLLDCLDSMLTPTYNKYIFYVHNLGGYDIAFILKIVIDLADKYPDIYKRKLTFREDKILAIQISKKIGTKTYSIKLVDSYNMLNSSLKNLSKSFETEVKKTLFPYSFISRYTLFYKGVKPDIKYFNIILDKEPNYDYSNTYTIEDYNEINDKWATEKETIEYLQNDLISLYEVMNKFKNQIYIDYKSHITNSLTISSLAMNIYLNSFYTDNIPLINKTSIYNHIKNSYYGGITEVYKPHGKNLFYYDVNSLYPFSSLNDMPGVNCTYMKNINKDIGDLVKDNKFFGFYYCDITTPDMYIGLIPVRTDTGLIMPLGSIKGWYFSEELKFAYENGYKIQVKEGYEFNRVSDVFNKYVNEFYKIKSTTKNETTKSIAKSLLNNLLGRFGLKIEGNKTSLVDFDEYNELLQTRNIKKVIFIGNKYLVTYDTEISLKVCKENKVNYEKAIIKSMNSNNKPTNFEQEPYSNVSIAISSAVTAYARIYINKIKLDIINKGGNIYYTDTDSIVTDIKLDENLVGNDLGQFKLEHEIDEAYFITTKTYTIKDVNNKITRKSKGSDKDLLKFEDYQNLYKGIKKETYRNEAIKDFSVGSVTLNKTPITLSPYSYVKRVKIYNEKGQWVDTKPISQNRSYSILSKIKKRKSVFFSILKFFIFLFLLFILSILIYIYMFSLLEINVDFIINDILIDYNQEKLYNKPLKIDTYKFNKTMNIPGYESIKYVYKDNSKEEIWNKYLSESKIIRRVFIDHIQSISEETKIKDRTISNLSYEIKELREENSRIIECINDISACIYKAKSPKL